MLKLTDDNYFSNEADLSYMSVSQFKGFLGCEAEAMAKLKGLYQQENKTALLVGSYVHANFEGALDKFKEDNPSIFTQKGTLKSEYKLANDMINCLETDVYFKAVYTGEKEKIFTGELFGAKWKIKVDCLNKDEGYFVDLKTTRDFEKQWIWDEEEERNEKVSFVIKWKYYIQVAIYREILKQNIDSEDLQAFIIAVTKQNPPDKIALHFIEDDYLKGLREVKDNIQHILEVKSGKIPPKRCEKCNYCRATKKLDKTVHYSEM